MIRNQPNLEWRGRDLFAPSSHGDIRLEPSTRAKGRLPYWRAWLDKRQLTDWRPTARTAAKAAMDRLSKD